MLIVYNKDQNCPGFEILATGPYLIRYLKYQADEIA